MSAHIAEWNRVWQNRFDINGNCDLAGKMRASYYYVLSSLPIGSTYNDDGWPFCGISPGSLANDDNVVRKFFIQSLVEILQGPLGGRLLGSVAGIQ